MKKKHLILLMLFSLTTACFAQMRQASVSFYGGDLSGESFGSFVKTDKRGNYFVAGRSYGYGSKFDYALVKYSPAGIILWERRYNGEGNGGDEPFGLLVDVNGNSYITGSSVYLSNNYKLTECVTIKYSPDGQILWTNKYRTNANLNSSGHSMTLDPEGNIYLAGYTGNAATKDILLMKINNKGETEWDRSFDANFMNEDYNDIIYLNKEHIYVCGTAIVDNANFLDFIILKYDTDGNFIWSRNHNGNVNGFDIARGIFVDKNENIYVTGFTENRNTKLDITTMKYTPDGNVVWVTDFNGTGDGFDWPNHVLVDDFGNVYVEGGSQNEVEINPECQAELGKCRNDATLIKYLPTGEIDWVRLYNGPDNMYDCLQGMALDKDNNIYVGGRSHSEMATTNDDIITMKFNTAGDRLWFMKYNSGTSKADYGNAIAIDDFGNVFTSGWSHARGPADFIVIKYAPSEISDNFTQPINLDNYPNPFNPSTKISFNLVDPSFTKLTVYDVTGREISVLANEYLGSGNHSFVFDAGEFNSGVYFYKLESGGNDGNKILMTKKMILVK